MFLGRELLAGEMRERQPQHERDHRVLRVLLEGGHVFSERVLKRRDKKLFNFLMSSIKESSLYLIRPRDEAVVPVEDPQRNVVGVP